MAIPLGSEIIKNGDNRMEGETDEDVKNKTDEKIKQDCELNAGKRLLKRHHEMYPNLKVRLLADSLYPGDPWFKLMKEYNMEYLIVLKDEKIPTITKEFHALLEITPENKLEIKEEKSDTTIRWINGIDYKDETVNIIEKITKYKDTGTTSKWMWITNRKVTKNNVLLLIKCAKCRDAIENRDFNEKKNTSGIKYEHTYSENLIAAKSNKYNHVYCTFIFANNETL